MSGDAMILHCGEGLMLLPVGAPADEVWVEHGYLYDRQDLEAHPMGRKYLETQAMEDTELVETSSCYHSLASVIEGEPVCPGTMQIVVCGHGICGCMRAGSCGNGGSPGVGGMECALYTASC